MKKRLLLLALQLAASGSDAYFTHRNQELPRHYEMNPVARPFIGSTPGLAGYFTAEATAKIVLAHEFRIHHHPALADASASLGIADNVFGATYSATHYKPAR